MLCILIGPFSTWHSVSQYIISREQIKVEAGSDKISPTWSSIFCEPGNGGRNDWGYIVIFPQILKNAYKALEYNT